MRFASPAWLYGLALIPFGYLIVRVFIQNRQVRFERFAKKEVWKRIAPELDWSKPKRKEKFFWAALTFVLLAAARPQWGKIEETVKTSGLDLILVVDISRSMETEDVVPNRLKKTKHMIRNLLERLNGDRVGLVAFAGSSYLSVPLTTDLAYLEEQVSILSPELIQNQGSDLKIALESARGALDRAAEEANGPKQSTLASKVAVLFSDGEDHEEGAIDFVKRFSETGIKLFTFTVGTAAGGPIPVRDDSGQLRGYKRTKKGEPVISKANIDYMEKLASAGGGKAWTASAAETEIDEMFQSLGGLQRADFTEKKIVTYHEQFQWPLFVAVFLILFEWALPSRRLERSPLSHLIKGDYSKTMKSLSVVFVALLLQSNAFAEALPSEVPTPKDNPITAEKVELGKMLYFDPRLSADDTISCQSCHNVMKAGDDGMPTSKGIKGQMGGRNAPTVFNAAFMSVMFWDGRMNTLEDQAKGPITNPIEMGMPNHQAVVDKLKKIPGYVTAFEKVFGKDSLNIDNLAKAIATYERTLITRGSPYDKFIGGDKKAMSESAQKGWKLVQEVGCISCHGGPNFAGPLLPSGTALYQKFPTFPGSAYDKKYDLLADLGRFEATKKDDDKNKWRVPTWRNVADTAPYFHNGRVKTLDEAVRVMAKTQLNRDLKDDLVKDIVAFLKALSAKPPKQTKPKLP
ncbi:MAG: VWA domain-containing protein [Bdellovibrionales bacterium]|nr:VWA domain-containing protein [Bdellovibrionales bacterium]